MKYMIASYDPVLIAEEQMIRRAEMLSLNFLK
nr:MAG TPA: hypothetical protein [Bacteriophage sp.]